MNDEPATALIVQPETPKVSPVALLFSQSSMVPPCYRGRPIECEVAIQSGALLGLGPHQSLQSIMLINGKLSLFGDGMIAIVLNSPLCEGVEVELEGVADDRVAICTVWRRGWKKKVVRRFSVTDAKQAKLWTKRGPWSDYPDRMLSRRALSFALRDTFADVLAGMQMAEEVSDYVNGEHRQTFDDFPPAEVDAPTSSSVASTPTAPTTTALLVDDPVGEPTSASVHDRCRRRQAARIRELFQGLKIPVAAAKAAIERRGASRLTDLSEEQAGELLRKLENLPIEEVF